MSGGILSMVVFNQQSFTASMQSSTKDIAKLLVKNSAMARQASLM
jgi:hypothetical protein